jgi:hypothetical protein
MIRAFPSALALACVCSPAMAAPLAFDPFGAAMDAVAVFIGGMLALVLLYAAILPLCRAIVDLFSRFGVGAAAITAVVLLGVAAHPALAQEAAARPGVTLPYGDWIASYGPELFMLLATWLAGVVSWAIGKFAPWAASVLTQKRIEMAAVALAQYGAKAVADATKGGKVTVDAGPAVIAAAVQRGVNVLPARVVKAMEQGGGMASIVFRVLDLEDDANEHNVLQPAIASLKSSADPKLAKAA